MTGRGAGHGVRQTAHSPLVRKFTALTELTNAEIASLEGLHRHLKSVAAGGQIIAEGERHKASMIIDEGWAIRYKMLCDGRRQVINFVLPGDIIGAFASVIESSDHSVAAITRLRIAAFEPQAILDLFASCPRLGALYGWAVGRDEAIVAEQVVRVGRRSAYERTAHLFLELLRRLQTVGLAGERSFELPLTQELLADTLGLSSVHVSRTLRRLRLNDLIRVTKGRVIIPDIERLEDVADFSGAYLKQERLPAKTEAELGSL